MKYCLFCFILLSLTTIGSWVNVWGQEIKTLAPVAIEDSLTPQQMWAGSNQVRFPVEKLTRIPALLGEPDVLRALSLLPGVTLGIEGTGGISVRGGLPSQNLILLDGAPVYNPQHLLGLVSAFHPEMVQSLELHKGYYPAHLGERTSSVIEMGLQTGSDSLQGEASIGAINSRVSLRGSVPEQRLSYAVGGRLAYLNLLTLPLNWLYRQGDTDQSLSYWLYDVTGSLSHRLQGGGRLRLSLYHSRDDFGTRYGQFEQDESLSNVTWGNLVGSLSYDRTWGTQHHWQSQWSSSAYRSGDRAEELIRDGVDSALQRSGLASQAGIQDHRWQNRYRYHLGPYRLEVGSSWGWLGAQPTMRRQFPQPRIADSSSSGVEGAWQGATWLQGRWESARWEAEAGLRWSVFHRPGTYTFTALEPRLSLTVKPTSRSRVEASYARSTQPLHLISHTQLQLPSELWVLADVTRPAQQADQWTLGGSVHGERWKGQGAVYYRRAKHQVFYQAPEIFGLLPDREEIARNLKTDGQARAYGLELGLNWEGKRASGWVGYTLAWSEWQFPGEPWRLTPFDQRHQIDLNLDWQLRPRLGLNLNWVLRSGRPIYVPISRIQNLEGEEVFVYSAEPHRLPTYHRLDIGWRIKHRTKPATWQIGVYNFYNRLNPLYLQFYKAHRDVVGDPPDQQFVIDPAEVRAQGGIPFLPYLSYSWKF